MGVFQNNLLAGAAAAASAGGGAFYSHQIEQSARFDRASSSYLYYSVPSGAATDANWTVSMWMKRGQLGIGDPSLLGNSAGWMRVKFTSADILSIHNQTTFVTSAVFRDTNGWTNVVMNSQDANNFKLYINGVDQTSDLTKSSVATHRTFFYPSTNAYVGTDTGGSTKYFDGYLAEVHLIYGLNKDADDFGETKNGVWIPKEYTGSYGTYGSYLKFENASDLGNDSSGNNNDWTVGGMGADHQVQDSPTFGS